MEISWTDRVEFEKYDMKSRSKGRCYIQ